VNKESVVANMGTAGSGKLFNNASANNFITGALLDGLFNRAMLAKFTMQGHIHNWLGFRNNWFRWQSR
jgi:hypothetical protein